MMMVGIILGMFTIINFLILMFFKGCSNESDKQKEDIEQIEWLKEYNRRKRDSKIWIRKQHWK